MTSRQKKWPRGKKKKTHGQRKNLSAPTLSFMPLGHCYFLCREVISLAASLLLLQWGYSFVLWGHCYFFCREVILLCSESFSFAASLLLLPWGYFFSRESFTFAVRLFFYDVRTLLFLLPWGYSFMQWVFFFCRESFTFAVRFSFAVRFFRLP